MIKEIERKFCVRKMPDLTACTGVEISQGYLSVGENDPEIRLRRNGERFYQTVKIGKGVQRTEVEVELSQAQFDNLWPLTEGRRVEKVRYEIAEGIWTIELDVYRGHLKGLIVAEVEFETIDESSRFVPPLWFGREVTDDDRYKNAILANKGTPDDHAQ
ncbi:MAG: CYTH domain-containing protein [Gemmatimonadetes bacterium]|nr:CYTH domain-containing protein [Gemmatimonadota bacterium]